MPGAVFKQVNYEVGLLLAQIEQGVIGLPDIQRPFVWNNAKVRDLFDSMYRGFPVGFLLFWQNGFSDDHRVIGTDKKQKTPQLLIVDGQQRLTSLYAVVKDIAVVRQNYASEQIRIAFNPLEERFAVTDAAIRRDKSYLPDISVLWDKDTALHRTVGDYLLGLEASRPVSEEERDHVWTAIARLQNLTSFSLIALELASDVDEEQVAEVFVRINSQGTPLNQANFILTLMSVFWDEGRAELEKFCSDSRQPSAKDPSPYNHFIQPDPDQLLRVSVGVAFKRARLHHVYSILRGKDLETEQFSETRRDQQFELLKEAQAKVLNLRHWHDFLAAIRQAGVRSESMISSKNNLLYSYVFYLLGRTEYEVDEFALRKAIARWYFMSSLTGRYSGSPESSMEFDLARLRDVTDADGFVRTLKQVCAQTLTEDYWSITLPNDLATAASRSPSLFAYNAALILLDARALYSDQKVADLLDPTLKAPHSGLARHHLFPRGYLSRINVTERREVNQIANYAFVEWGDNTDISDDAPADYAPLYEKRFPPQHLERQYYWHALPANWQALDFGDFLIQRRERMAKVIRAAYEQLCLGPKDSREMKELNLAAVVAGGENDYVEFKSTLRINLHTKQVDRRIEDSWLKTVAGFLNASGGRLVVGVADDGQALGIDADDFSNEDRMGLHLINVIRARIGPEYVMYVHPRFEDYENERALVVECKASTAPIYVKDGNTEHFYVRTGPSTSELSHSQTVAYIKQRYAAEAATLPRPWLNNRRRPPSLAARGHL